MLVFYYFITLAILLFVLWKPNLLNQIPEARENSRGTGGFTPFGPGVPHYFSDFGVSPLFFTPPGGETFGRRFGSLFGTA